jgi:hypothetical protein
MAAINLAGLRIPIEVLVGEGSGDDRVLRLSTEGGAVDNLISACDKRPSRVSICVRTRMISVAYRRVEETSFLRPLFY